MLNLVIKTRSVANLNFEISNLHSKKMEKKIESEIYVFWYWPDFYGDLLCFSVNSKSNQVKHATFYYVLANTGFTNLKKRFYHWIGGFQFLSSLFAIFKWIYTPQTHFGSTNMESKMHIFRVISCLKVKNRSGTPCKHILAFPTKLQRCNISVLHLFHFVIFQMEHPVNCQRVKVTHPCLEYRLWNRK